MTRAMGKKIMIITVTAASTLFANQMDAYCAKCVKIEEDRAKEQALHPKPAGYYDDQVDVHHQGKSQKSDTETAENSTGSGALRGSTYRFSTEPEKSSKSSKEDSDLSTSSKHDQLLAANTTTKSNLGGYFEENDVPGGHDKGPSKEKIKTSSSKTTPAKLPTGSQFYSTVYTIFKTKNFLETLDGAFTLFIPTNAALQKLPAGMLVDLIRPENAEKLAALVSNHVVAQKILPHDFVEKSNLEVKAISGRNLTLLFKNNQYSVDNISILSAEAAGFDGVIYLIDEVLK